MLDSITQSPRFYDYVAYGVLFLAVFNVAEILFLLFHKRRVERSEARRTELKRLASTALITATDPAALLPPPKTEDEFAAYSEAIASVLDSFEGEIAEAAAGLLTKMGIDAHYRALARHRAWYKRGNAIDILAAFKLRSSREFFLAAFRSEPTLDVKYRILYGLSRLTREHGDILELAHLLSTLPYLTAKFTEDIFYNITSALKAAGREEEFGTFMGDLLGDESVLPMVKRDCITACYSASFAGGRSLLRRYFEKFTHEPEIQMAAVRALARIGDFSVMHAAMASPDWRVRLTALKYAHLCCTELSPDVRRMLRDPNYHVRMNAAMALARSGDTGRAILKAETVSEDKYASAAAAYALTQEAA